MSKSKKPANDGLTGADLAGGLNLDSLDTTLGSADSELLSEDADATSSTPPKKERPSQPKRFMATFTVGVLLVFFGKSLILSRAGMMELSVSAVAAIALAITGIGLFMSAFSNPARSLIPLGLAFVALVTLFWGSEASWDFEIKNLQVKITDAHRLQDTYGHGIGSFVLDLTDYKPENGTRSVDIDLSTGDVVVHVPCNLKVSAEIEVAFGVVKVTESQLSEPYGGLDDGAIPKLNLMEDRGLWLNSPLLLLPSDSDSDETAAEIHLNIVVGVGSVLIDAQSHYGDLELSPCVARSVERSTL
ncbi:MAG: LiaF-related protein [Acidimicrobiaceae bacterium]|nr:LiaF-related protein [Acidimicrobiaceae bacterium]